GRAPRGIAQLLERIPADRLYVADLRQESHCFADGAALSWYAAMNWGCAGLDAAECAQLEALRIRLLQLSESAEVGTKDDVKARRRPAQVRKLGAVSGEASALGLAAGRYVRFPVTD